MKKIDLLVEGGKVVAGGAVVEATVAVAEGTIVALLAPDITPPEATGARRIDAAGKIVIPGVIDAHCHFATFNEQADSFGSLSVSAAFGGVTTVVPYARGRPDMPSRQFLARFRDEGEAQSVVDFAFHCRLAPTQGGTEQIDDALDLGVTSFKMFMASRQPESMWDDFGLYRMVEHVARKGGLFCCHAENGDLVEYLEQKYRAEGRYLPENYPASRPAEAEAEAVHRAVTIAGLAGCPLYLPHMGTARGIAVARWARSEGQDVWVESCPHYLTLTSEEMRRQGGLAKMAPPLRSASDVESTWVALAEGSVDVVASDHAPWPLSMKELPADRFHEVPLGIPGTEVLLPLLYSEGVLRGRIDLPRMVELLCAAPARIFGLAPRKGSIAVGADADLVLVDPAVEWTIAAAEMHSLAGYTPYEGMKVRGKPVMTISRGKVVVQNGRLVGSPGDGRYIPRVPRG